MTVHTRVQRLPDQRENFPPYAVSRIRQILVRLIFRPREIVTAEKKAKLLSREPEKGSCKRRADSWHPSQPTQASPSKKIEENGLCLVIGLMGKEDPRRLPFSANGL
jgi:hypothetical protein